MAHDNQPNLQVEGWLETLGIESLCQWDVLVFLDRHQPTLVSAEHIARFLGYATAADVVAALDSVESRGLVQPSRVSQGVRLYQLTAPADPTRRDAVERLMTLADGHTVRRYLGRRLRGDDRPTKTKRLSVCLAWRRVNHDRSDVIQTGIYGLDQIFLDGILKGNVILVEGAVGTGKTLLGLEFIYRGITEHDEPGIIVVFETSPRKLIRDAAGFGWNLDELQQQNKLKIIFTSPKVLDQELRSPDSLLLETAAEIGARASSLTAFRCYARSRLTTAPTGTGPPPTASCYSSSSKGCNART